VEGNGPAFGAHDDGRQLRSALFLLVGGEPVLVVTRWLRKILWEQELLRGGLHKFLISVEVQMLSSWLIDQGLRL